MRAAPEEIQGWMGDRARLAVAIRVGQRLVAPMVVPMDVIEEAARALADGSPRPDAAASDALPRPHQERLAALLRLLCGDSYLAIAQRLGVTESTAQRLAASFRRRCERGDAELVASTSTIVRSILHRAFGAVPASSPLAWTPAPARTRNGRASRNTLGRDLAAS